MAVASISVVSCLRTTEALLWLCRHASVCLVTYRHPSLPAYGPGEELLLELKRRRGETYSNSCNHPKGQKGIKPNAKQKVSLHCHSQPGCHARAPQSTSSAVLSLQSRSLPKTLICFPLLPTGSPGALLRLHAGEQAPRLS